MWHWLIVKELRALARDGRLVALALLWLALFAGLAVVNGMQQQQLAQERAAVHQATRMQWDSQGDKHPHRGAHYGLYAFRPALPLAALDPGLVPHVGQALYLEPHRRNIARFSDAADEPIHVPTALTPAFAVQALLPLLLFGLAFSLVAHERENGTLRLLQASGVSAHRLMAAKVMAVMVMAVGLLLPGFAAAMWGMGPAAWQADHALRAAGFAGTALVYALAHAVLGVAASALLPSSRAALFALLAVWTAFVLILPRIGAEVARRQVPLPAPAAFWAGIQHDYHHGLDGEGDLATQLKRFEARTLQAHGVDRPEQLPVGFNALRRLFRDAHADRVHARHFAALWERYAAQQRTALAASGFSPALAWRMASMAWTGTDLAHERHFQDAAEHYRRTVNTLIDRWDAAHTRGIVSADLRYAEGRLWRSIPVFAYREPGVTAAWQSAWVGCTVLAVWVGAAVLLVARAARALRP